MAEDVEVMSVNKEGEEDEEVTLSQATSGHASPGRTVSTGSDISSSNVTSQSSKNVESSGKSF